MRIVGGVVLSLVTLYYWWYWINSCRNWNVLRSYPEADIIGDTRKMKLFRFIVIMIVSFLFGLLLVKWSIGLLGIGA